MRSNLLSTLVAAISVGFASTVAGVSMQASGIINPGPFTGDLNGMNWTYPHPVQTFEFTSQQTKLQMAFMDVKPCCTPNGKTIVLMHGKNFCGVTWTNQIDYFTNQGYRVVVPDQIGWCKSTKPPGYQFSISQLAFNTKGLLDALGLDKVIVLGHSFGGTIAIHIAIQYPDLVEALLPLDAIGMEDYWAKGVPYIGVDDNINQELSSTFASVQAYETMFYYAGNWKDEYGQWIDVLMNVYTGSQRENFCICQGKIVDLVLTQSNTPYFAKVIAPTLLMVGDLDKSFIGAWASSSVIATLGDFKDMGPQVCSQMAHCTVHIFTGQGHASQISEPDLFNDVVHTWLLSQE